MGSPGLCSIIFYVLFSMYASIRRIKCLSVCLFVCLSLCLSDYVNEDDDDDDSDAYAFRKYVGMSEAVLKPCWYG